MLDAHAPDNPRERFTTMSIATHGKSTVDNHARVVPGRPMNRVDDIDGAQPQMRHTRFGGERRPDLFSTQDIAGAMPKHLHPQPRNKPCYNNSNADIEGSIPHPYTFKTNRHVNPLEPEYSLSVNPSREPVRSCVGVSHARTCVCAATTSTHCYAALLTWPACALPATADAS